MRCLSVPEDECLVQESSVTAEAWKAGRCRPGEGGGMYEAGGGRYDDASSFIINVISGAGIAPPFSFAFPSSNSATDRLGQAAPVSEASQPEMAAVRIRHTG